ncbi:membrane protein [Arthrobacter phage Qui]|jgi:hypothetical protein|uniref:Membrane protein n=1 Tax=Arthrobacter phage Qui TaxID=2603260 RepID=A0A5B8WK06_9CAUD|nr:membrane protein [Arthrobacter phage Qui]QED11546.1 membrane protein [Arthrobacter phage Qui]QOC56378.1 membrane protein [Arthrobacter phage Paella]
MKNHNRDFYIGVTQGLIIGAAAAYGTIQLVKLGVDWAKAGIQELKERKEIKTNH